MPSSRSRYITPCAVAWIALIAFLGITARADADALKPPANKVFFGVTDTGSAGGYRSFAQAVGKRPAVIQTFHPWGNTLSKAMPRWRSIKARPMLHITTKSDDGVELITPRAIAYGYGDDYLVRLNRVLSEQRVRAYIRPMGEPNRCLNPYAGVDCSGNVRGGAYSFKSYRAAFRRIAIIVRGGAKRGWINARLKRVGLPKVKRRTKAKLPRRMKAAPVSMIWSPLPAGSPTVKANYPARYWPGRAWVDWVATDFYSRYNNWKHLKRFYVRWAKRKSLPMALTEFGLWGADKPGYVKRIFRFTRTRKRMRMMVYYQDFGTSNPFRIQNFPRSLKMLKRQLKRDVFPRYAPKFPRQGRNSGKGGGVVR